MRLTRGPVLAVCISVVLLPGVAVAEVMDKEVPPWSPPRLLACVLGVALCTVLMTLVQRSAGLLRAVALLLASAIGLAYAIGGAWDDFLSPQVGAAMRVELGNLSAAYAVGLFLEAAGPIGLVIVLAIRCFRARRSLKT